ncbi:hypothetical protein DERF_002696 [Dermatophagoides farinae]|uniref:Uncharacterized protein n=1 Tax=Dermatophagoides farinae TaxID=6954 RepID=A0A922IDM5_DERFA|nr:hypothetical protein DERF_002696 [Dermatophagoides farinae]
MTGKRHRKPFVDKWGKLSDIVNIRMQLFDIGAIFIFNLASKRFRSTFFTYDIGIKLNLIQGYWWLHLAPIYERRAISGQLG